MQNINNTQKITATVVGYDAAGNVVPVAGNVNWGNSNSSVATHAPNDTLDVFTSVGPVGSSNIFVQVSGPLGTFISSDVLNVTAGPLASVAIVWGTPEAK